MWHEVDGIPPPGIIAHGIRPHVLCKIRLFIKVIHFSFFSWFVNVLSCALQSPSMQTSTCCLPPNKHQPRSQERDSELLCSYGKRRSMRVHHFGGTVSQSRYNSDPVMVHSSAHVHEQLQHNSVCLALTLEFPCGSTQDVTPQITKNWLPLTRTSTEMSRERAAVSSLSLAPSLPLSFSLYLFPFLPLPAPFPLSPSLSVSLCLSLWVVRGSGCRSEWLLKVFSKLF